MNRKTRWIVGTGLAVALVGGGTGMALATAGDNETPITGEALGKASAAALVSTGGGRVSGTEVGDEEGYYEVEVALPGGGQVDVHLDSAFNVLHTTGDKDGKGDQDGSNDR